MSSADMPQLLKDIEDAYEQVKLCGDPDDHKRLYWAIQEALMASTEDTEAQEREACLRRKVVNLTEALKKYAAKLTEGQAASVCILLDCVPDVVTIEEYDEAIRKVREGRHWGGNSDTQERPEVSPAPAGDAEPEDHR